MKSRSIQPSRDQHVARGRRAAPDPTWAASGRCCVAAIAVSVVRGSMTMISGWCGLRITRCHRIGWAMHRFAADEDDARRTPRSRRRCTAARRSRTPACRRRPTVAMHCRVLPSPCTMPMPNLASAPSSAISSVAIWPVLRNATDCGPCCCLDRLEARRRTCVSAVVPVDRLRAAPRASRSSGVVARSGASSSVSASQPLGQAMPRFTG